MRRREFITLIGGAAAAWPVIARAQQTKRHLILGILMNAAANDVSSREFVAAFEGALRKAGWAEGENLQIERRWRSGNAEQALTYARELADLAPNAILSSSTTNLAALLKWTKTIPIVFVQVSDPVAQGFVSNLSHPDGLKQTAPALSNVAVIFNPDTSPQSKLFVRSAEAAAPSFGVNIIETSIRRIADLEPAITNLVHQSNGGLVFPTDSFTTGHAELIVELAARYRLPAIYARPEFMMAGGLMRYSIDYIEQYQQAAAYIDGRPAGSATDEVHLRHQSEDRSGAGARDSCASAADG